MSGGNTADNASRVFAAVEQFGASFESDAITPETFTRNEINYQIGVAPIRIDILTQITGIEFSAAWRRQVRGTIFGIPIPFISLEDLTTNKGATGRTSDLDQLRISKKAQPDDQD
jgi:hypothetical protein